MVTTLDLRSMAQQMESCFQVAKIKIDFDRRLFDLGVG